MRESACDIAEPSFHKVEYVDWNVRNKNSMLVSLPSSAIPASSLYTYSPTSPLIAPAGLVPRALCIVRRPKARLAGLKPPLGALPCLRCVLFFGPETIWQEHVQLKYPNFPARSVYLRGYFPDADAEFVNVSQL